MYGGKNAVFRFIEMILREYSYCRKVRRKLFNKNLVTTTEENERFERTNILWICGKLINFDEKYGFVVN